MFRNLIWNERKIYQFQNQMFYKCIDCVQCNFRIFVNNRLKRSLIRTQLCFRFRIWTVPSPNYSVIDRDRSSGSIALMLLGAVASSIFAFEETVAVEKYYRHRKTVRRQTLKVQWPAIVSAQRIACSRTWTQTIVACAIKLISREVFGASGQPYIHIHHIT